MAKFPLPEGWNLVAEDRQHVRAMIAVLAGVCDGARTWDGAGFSGADADFGHSLAGLTEAQWTLGRYWAAYNMLRKYREQLAANGLDYFRVDPICPEMPGPERLAPQVIEVDNVPVTAVDFDRWETINAITHGNTPVQAWQLPPTPRSAQEVAAEFERPAPKPGAAPYTARAILGPQGVIAQQLPGYEHRPEQLELAELIERGMMGELNAVTEAGTGTGKSMAYLVPSILMSYRAPITADPYADDAKEPHNPRTIVSTADKGLQAQLWGKDIPFLKSVMPKPFKAALLKGRGNYLCLRNFSEGKATLEAPMLDGFGDEEEIAEAGRFREVVEWEKTTASGDLEELPFIIAGNLRDWVATDTEGCTGQHCPFYKRCYAEQAKKIAKNSDVIIVNHALLLRDLAVRMATSGQMGVLPEAEYVVIDEAHHLQDIATDAFGTELTAGGFNRIVRELDKMTMQHEVIVKALASETPGEEVVKAQAYEALGVRLGENADTVFSWLRSEMAHAGVTVRIMGDDVPILGPAANLMIDTADEMAQSAPYWLKDEAERERWGKLSERLMVYGRKLLTAATPDPDNANVRYAELSGSRVVLNVKPVDVSEMLRAGLFESEHFRAVVATSATIATEGAQPFAYWQDQVGCEAPLQLQVGSPFNYARNALLYLPEDGRAFDPTQSRQDGSIEYLDRLAAEYERLILSSSGRAFALFTSFKTLHEVYTRLSPRLSRSYLVLKQGEMTRPELVARFREDGNAVLFGVKSFWEGVDVQGAALSMVIIDKLPFTPPDDPIWQARCARITKLTGDQWAWFNRMAVPNTIIALKQGFGRLIRTKDDRGVVAILDGRLTTKPYGTRVVRALPPATQTRRQEAVAAFFRS